jgi:hypothetical protein
MRSNILMFSIAQNGYDFIYSKCIKSQELYARINSYDYVLVNRPRWVNAAVESAWLKIPLILEGLSRGYEWVFFIDADCEIRPQAPRVESLEVPGKYLYLVQGRSGRVNSGVIITKNTPDTRSFFQKVLNSIERQVPEEDRKNIKYENGHIIYHSKQIKYMYLLDLRWNNTYNSNLNDYIRHYTGPMRQYYQKPILSDIKVKTLKISMKIRDRFAKSSALNIESQESLKHRLEILTQFCKKEFPAFRNSSM